MLGKCCSLPFHIIPFSFSTKLSITLYFNRKRNEKKKLSIRISFVWLKNIIFALLLVNRLTLPCFSYNVFSFFVLLSHTRPIFRSISLLHFPYFRFLSEFNLNIISWMLQCETRHIADAFDWKWLLTNILIVL